MLLQPSCKWIQGSEGHKKTSLSCWSGVKDNNHGDDHGIKDNLWYLPQEPTHLLWDCITEPGAHEVGQIGLPVSPREPPISISTARHSSMYVCMYVCTTMSRIFTWDWKPNLPCLQSKHSIDWAIVPVLIFSSLKINSFGRFLGLLVYTLILGIEPRASCVLNILRP